MPHDYRSSFTNYLSLDRVQNADQIIRLFANKAAMEGVDAEGKLPYGSVLVGEVYKARRDADGNIMTSELGRRIRGELALIAVMKRDRDLGGGHAPHLTNGNWEFAAFKPDGTVAGKDLNECRACHAPLTRQDHVFSIEHLPRR